MHNMGITFFGLIELSLQHPTSMWWLENVIHLPESLSYPAGIMFGYLSSISCSKSVDISSAVCSSSVPPSVLLVPASEGGCGTGSYLSSSSSCLCHSTCLPFSSTVFTLCTTLPPSSVFPFLLLILLFTLLCILCLNPFLIYLVYNFLFI